MDAVTQLMHRQLVDAVRQGDTEAVNRVLSSGVSILSLEEQGDVWRTPLMEAAASGQGKMIRMLVEEQGVCVNAKNKHSSTALHWAVMGCHSECVSALLEKGAEVNASDDDGFTALHIAAYWCNSTIGRLLLNAGADANFADVRGRTPLAELLSQVDDVVADPGQLEAFHDFIQLLIHHHGRGWKDMPDRFPVSIDQHLSLLAKYTPEEIPHVFKVLNPMHKEYIRTILLVLKRYAASCSQTLALRIISCCL